MYSHLPHDELMCIAGLGLCFFGGVFPVTVAAYEGFRLGGWESTKAHLIQIRVEIEKIKLHQNDGAKRVSEMTADELLTHEVQLVLKHVDPTIAQSAATGLLQGVAGMIATLQSRFAKTVALGASIADCFRVTGMRLLAPMLAHSLAEEHHRWIPFVIEWLAKSLAVSVAWTLQLVISAVHASIRGGSMFVKHGIKAAHARGFLLGFDPVTSNADEVASVLVAGLGIYWQFSHTFGLPFPLSTILSPISMIEWTLKMTLGARV